MAKRKNIIRKTYKVWLVLEEHTEYDDGSDKYKDLKDLDDTLSAGSFQTIEEARSLMSEISSEATHI